MPNTESTGEEVGLNCEATHLVFRILWISIKWRPNKYSSISNKVFNIKYFIIQIIFSQDAINI